MCAYAYLPAPIDKTIYCFHLRSVNKAKMVRTLYLKRELACITQIKRVALGLSFRPLLFHCIQDFQKTWSTETSAPYTVPCLPSIPRSSNWPIFPCVYFHSLFLLSPSIKGAAPSFTNCPSRTGGFPTAIRWPPLYGHQLLTLEVHTACFCHPVSLDAVTC